MVTQFRNSIANECTKSNHHNDFKINAQIHSFGSHHLNPKPGFMSKVRLSRLQLILIFTLIGIGSAASVGIRNEKQNLDFNGFNVPLNLLSLRVGNNNTEFGGKQCQPDLNSFRAVTHNLEYGSFQWLLTSTGRPFVSEGDFAAVVTFMWNRQGRLIKTIPLLYCKSTLRF